MGGDTDRALCCLGSVRMLMRGECYRRPEGQQHTKTRYPLRYRPHDGYPMEASFESIPKRQTNATKRVPTLLIQPYPGMYTQPAYVLCFLAARLVVVIGKTRVKTQHDDDHCPQNDQ